MIKYIFVLLLNTSFFAQVKGVVVDEKGNPIPYVSIWVENEDKGTTSEEDGTFLLNVELNKTLIFSALGFETKKVKASEAEKVILKEVIYQLDDVTISSPIGKETITVGNYDEEKAKSGYGQSLMPWKVAKYFPPTKEIEIHRYLKSLSFGTRTINKKAKLIIQFYDVNQDGSPGNSLLTDNFVFNLVKGNKKNEVIIEHLKLQFPDNGLFVVFEWLLIEDNFSTFTYTKNEENNKIKHKEVRCDPTVAALFSDFSNTWRFSKEQWKINTYKFPKDSSLKDSQNKYLELAVSLTLTN